MAFKQLGAVDITSTSSETTLYTVGVGKQTVVSSISICNKNTSAATIRVSHIPAGQSVGNAYYILYDRVIDVKPANLSIQLGIAMAAGDILSVYSTVANVNFIAWGDEV